MNVRMLLLAVWIMSGSVLGQDAPKTQFGFDPEAVPSPDPRRGQPVARVFGEYIYRTAEPDSLSQRDYADWLAASIARRLRVWLMEKEGITATPLEIEQYVIAFRGEVWQTWWQDTEGALADLLIQELAMHWMAAGMVSNWKFDRLLYSRYGGTVIFQQFNPQEPVGAEHQFLKEAEAAGVIEIFDPQIRKTIWKYYEEEDGSLVNAISPGEVNFDQPWWLRSEDREPEIVGIAEPVEIRSTPTRCNCLDW